MKTFIILAVILLGVNSNAILDGLNFNKYWFGENSIRNQVALSWTRTGANLDFHLQLPDYGNQISNIVDLVFLRKAPGQNTYITQFNPTRTISGGFIHHRESISISDFDAKDGNYKDCTRADVPGNDDQQSQVCEGFLAIIHKIDSGNGADRDKDFQSSLDLAMVRWKFQLEAIYNLVVSDQVDLKVKTKVEDLPCANCNCDDDCELDVNFKLDHQICGGPAKTDCPRSDNIYTFADQGYFYFFLDIKTRRLTPHQIHASSIKDSSGAPLPLSYIIGTHVDQPGELLISLPIAGPASEAGLKFNLKFTFRLESLARRFLEDANDRVLQKKTKAKVAVTNIKNIDASTPPKKLSLKEQINANNNAELKKVYNLCAAIIGVIALTCVCATIANIIPAFKKKSYAEIPNQAKA